MSEEYRTDDEHANETAAPQEGPQSEVEKPEAYSTRRRGRSNAIDVLEDIWARFRQNRILLDRICRDDIIYANGQTLRQETCEALAGILETYKELEPRFEAAVEAALRAEKIQ